MLDLLIEVEAEVVRRSKGDSTMHKFLANDGANANWVAPQDGRTPLEAARGACDEKSQRELSARQPDRRFVETVEWLESL